MKKDLHGKKIEDTDDHEEVEQFFVEIYIQFEG